MRDSTMDGLSLLNWIKDSNPEIPVLMISGHGTVEIAVNAIKAGAYDFIEKPFKSEKLLFMVSRALENSELKKENDPQGIYNIKQASSASNKKKSENPSRTPITKNLLELFKREPDNKLFTIRFEY